MNYGSIHISQINDSDYLAHHGILGQRWGVRRYQNEDGTLTAAGKIRYGKTNSTKLNKAYNTKIKKY